MVIRIAACCADEYRRSIAEAADRYMAEEGVSVSVQYAPTHRDFLATLRGDSLWDCLIVAEPGARGMETVISTRELAPETPLFWCSDDADFAVTSYRLRCTQFLPLPPPAEHIAYALQRTLR